MKLEDIYQMVMSYPTSSKYGFTRGELIQLLSSLNIDFEVFCEEFGINTCRAVDGEVRYYHADIFNTLKKILFNIEPNSI